MRRTFELGLGIATLPPIPSFLAGVIVLIADTPADGEFPLLPVPAGAAGGGERP
jgi:hypothetical protein